MYKENFNLSKVNTYRLLRTVRGSLKKALFYLDAKVPYSLTSDLVNLSGSDLKNYIEGKGKEIMDIIQIDAKIRYYDDILDNQLSKIEPKPIEKMKDVIKEFSEDIPEASDIARLFYLELEISNGSFPKEKLQEKIKELIEIRPSDFFILIDKIVRNFGSSLSKNDLKKSIEFYKEFQRLRDLLDDMMSIEEDLIKKDYNSVVVACQNNISYHFFEEIVLDKFNSLKKIAEEINNHSHKSIFKETIDFWEITYDTLFKKLLISYYIDLEEFRKSYFLIKQL